MYILSYHKNIVNIPIIYIIYIEFELLCLLQYSV